MKKKTQQKKPRPIGRPATRSTQTAQHKNPLVQAFSGRLREWRRESGKTLKEVSADTGLSMAILCEWEHGHRFPSVEHLQDISEYCKIPAWCLLYTGKGVPPGMKARKR